MDEALLYLELRVVVVSSPPVRMETSSDAEFAMIDVEAVPDMDDDPPLPCILICWYDGGRYSNPARSDVIGALPNRPAAVPAPP